MINRRMEQRSAFMDSQTDKITMRFQRTETQRSSRLTEPIIAAYSDTQNILK
jgi:hypothetical protein